MPMKNPVHPGLIVRHDCIEPLNLTITAAAKVLGVTRQALNNVVTCKSAISPEMAIRLSKASAVRRKHGSGCNSLTILLKPARRKAKSRCAASIRCTKHTHRFPSNKG
jgi:addiction module HigA family antidote